MGSPERPTTRRYTRAQKDQAVRLVRQIRGETGQQHGAVQRVAAQLGYGVESVRSWVKQADIDDGEAAARRWASPNTVQLGLQRCSLVACHVRGGGSRSRIVGCRIWCRWGC